MTWLLPAFIATLSPSATNFSEVLASLISGLGADNIEHRARCSHLLLQFGDAALAHLEGAEGHSDPEIADRAREAYQSICSRLPSDGREPTATTLHSLAIGMQRWTGSTILWTEDLCLRDWRIQFTSDRSVMNEPLILWEVFNALLQTADLALKICNSEAGSIFKIRSAPCSKRLKACTGLLKCTLRRGEISVEME